MARWAINIDNFHGGFAPGYHKETYPSYGNKNMAGDMLNCDLTNPGFVKAGPKLATLTNGDEAGVFTTNLKGIISDHCAIFGRCWGLGGAKLYKITQTAVTSGASDGITWPYTINHPTGTGESGEDIIIYGTKVYFTYNHSGGGDIGQYNYSGQAIDDDWGSTVPTGAGALQASVPHPLEVGGNDVMYFGNNYYVGDYDGTTFDRQALNLPIDFEIQAIKWYNDRLWIAANRWLVGGVTTERSSSSIFVWDGTTDTWESEIKTAGGRIGALHVRDGILYVFYEDISYTGGQKLGYVSGGRIINVVNFKGALPKYYQVSDFKDFILWVSSDRVYAWGTGDVGTPARLFQYMQPVNTNTIGGLAAPFGEPIISSFNGTADYNLERHDASAANIDVDSNWKSLMFDITGNGKVSKIHSIRFNFEQLDVNLSRLDWKLLNNKGATIVNDTISGPKLGAVTTAFYNLGGKEAENFRVELDWTNDTSGTTNVKVKSIKITGESN